jgi:hypothetical protein
MENIPENIKLIYICGDDDQNLPALKNATVLVNRRKNNSDIWLFSDTGHLIEPPSPHCSECVSTALGGQMMTFGGSDVQRHLKGRKKGNYN